MFIELLALSEVEISFYMWFLRFRWRSDLSRRMFDMRSFRNVIWRRSYDISALFALCSLHVLLFHISTCHCICVFDVLELRSFIFTMYVRHAGFRKCHSFYDAFMAFVLIVASCSCLQFSRCHFVYLRKSVDPGIPGAVPNKRRQAQCSCVQEVERLTHKKEISWSRSSRICAGHQLHQ